MSGPFDYATTPSPLEPWYSSFPCVFPGTSEHGHRLCFPSGRAQPRAFSEAGCLERRIDAGWDKNTLGPKVRAAALQCLCGARPVGRKIKSHPILIFPQLTGWVCEVLVL